MAHRGTLHSNEKGALYDDTQHYGWIAEVQNCTKEANTGGDSLEDSIYITYTETELVCGVRRQHGGLGQHWMEEAQGKVFRGLRRFRFSIWILVTQTIQFLNILLDCTRMQSAFFCKYVVFQQKVNRQKQAMSPNLTSQTPCFLALSHWYQMAWPSEDGFQRMAGVTSPKTRREKVENCFLRFNNCETVDGK